MIAIALLAIVAAMLLIRVGWAGRRGAAAAGWAIAVAALFALASRDGAWGLAVGTVVGIAAALALVLHEGWRSPAKVQRPTREAPSIMLPQRWSDGGRRVMVFVLVVPVAFVAAQWLAFGAQALARRAGMHDADTLVMTLFLQPTLWSVLMCWQMTRNGPAKMVAAPIATAALGTILWGAA